MITWEDFKKNTQYDIPDRYQPTEISCPKCGNQLCKDISQVLTTYPPKFMYKCFACNWVGYC